VTCRLTGTTKNAKHDQTRPPLRGMDECGAASMQGVMGCLAMPDRPPTYSCGLSERCGPDASPSGCSLPPSCLLPCVFCCATWQDRVPRPATSTPPLTITTIIQETAATSHTWPGSQTNHVIQHCVCVSAALHCSCNICWPDMHRGSKLGHTWCAYLAVGCRPGERVRGARLSSPAVKTGQSRAVVPLSPQPHAQLMALTHHSRTQTDESKWCSNRALSIHLVFFVCGVFLLRVSSSLPQGTQQATTTTT
jgi:hypothetical protein